MAKFIIEVSDNYIRERADVDTIQILAKQKDADPLHIFADMVVFSTLESEIDKGNNEFVIKSEDIEEDKLKMFNDTVTMVGALAKICKKVNK